MQSPMRWGHTNVKACRWPTVWSSICATERCSSCSTIASTCWPTRRGSHRSCSTHCRGVRVLATSREGLGVAGEQLVALSSLSVPDASADADAITASEAIQLFVDRAVAARAGFTLGPADLASAAEICQRLDGMPLAIELAAARVTAMSPAEIATKLDDRFRLLTEEREAGCSVTRRCGPRSSES